MKLLEKNCPKNVPLLLVVLTASLLQIAPPPVQAAEEPPVASTDSPQGNSNQRSPTPAAAATSQNGLRVDDIVITGTWTPHAQKDSPVEIERITSKMLEQAGATNLRQVLQDIPAIELRRSAGGFQTFQIQGLESKHTLFLVNGQELIGSIEGATFTRDLLASPEVGFGLTRMRAKSRGPASTPSGSTTGTPIGRCSSRAPPSAGPTSR